MEPEDPGSPTEDNTERSLQDYKVEVHHQHNAWCETTVTVPGFWRNYFCSDYQ